MTKAKKQKCSASSVFLRFCLSFYHSATSLYIFSNLSYCHFFISSLRHSSFCHFVILPLLKPKSARHPHAQNRTCMGHLYRDRYLLTPWRFLIHISQSPIWWIALCATGFRARPYRPLAAGGVTGRYLGG